MLPQRTQIFKPDEWLDMQDAVAMIGACAEVSGYFPPTAWSEGNFLQNIIDRMKAIEERSEYAA